MNFTEKSLLESLNKKLNSIPKGTQCFYYNFSELLPNQSENNTIKILIKICRFTFSPEKESVYENAIKNLNEDEFKILEEIVDKIQNDELKSRIADILFIKRRHHKYAKMAIYSFLKVGRDFLEITSDKVPEVNQFFYRFKRAIQISLSIKDNFIIKQIAKDLKCYLEKTPQPFKNDYLIECLLKLLKLTGDQCEFCLKFIENNLDKITNIHDKDRICDIGVEVAKKLKQQEKINNFHRHKAKNLYEEANRFALEGENYIGAYVWLKKALEDLKKINPKLPEDEILENSWEKLLTKFTKKMQEGLAQVNVEFNSDPLIKEINKRLDELKEYNSDIFKTLLLFTTDRLLEEEYFSQETEKTLADYVGKIIVGNGAKEIPNSDSKKEKAVQKFNHFHLILRVLEIEKLRNYIIQNFKKDDINQAISFFINDNPLLPKQKLNQIFQAIWFGFFGEWIVSSYIIPAQIESMLRIRLENAGIYSRKTDEKNLTQQDRLLSKILSDSEYRNYLDKDDFLGKNFIFHIEALLNHKHGANLRNEVYHGYCDDDFFKDPPNIYLWWLFLKIIIASKLKSLKKKHL